MVIRYIASNLPTALVISNDTPLSSDSAAAILSDCLVLSLKEMYYFWRFQPTPHKCILEASIPPQCRVTNVI